MLRTSTSQSSWPTRSTGTTWTSSRTTTLSVPGCLLHGPRLHLSLVVPKILFLHALSLELGRLEGRQGFELWSPIITFRAIKHSPAIGPRTTFALVLLTACPYLTSHSAAGTAEHSLQEIGRNQVSTCHSSTRHHPTRTQSPSNTNSRGSGNPTAAAAAASCCCCCECKCKWVCEWAWYSPADIRIYGMRWC